MIKLQYIFYLCRPYNFWLHSFKYIHVAHTTRYYNQTYYDGLNQHFYKDAFYFGGADDELLEIRINGGIKKQISHPFKNNAIDVELCLV